MTRFDLPEHDARDYEDLAGLSRGHDVLVHLAWDTATESWRSGDISLDNQLMTVNAYEAALRTGVPRVIMASSVHADDYSGWTGAELMKATAVPAPDSPYGASKVFMEALGRYYAKQGLEVVCVRFMGVTPDGRPSPQDPAGKKKWLSHRDCGDLMEAIVEAPVVPDNFVVLYAVSANPGRMHDSANPFGWVPKDSAG